MLLVNDAVPASTVLELDRLGVSSVTVLGGSSVVPDSVVTSLNARVPTARVAGSDRYATAVAIVQAGFASADTVYVATGSNFPDALAGVPAAAGDAAPILLVQQNSIPAATATQLARLRPKTIKILGGEVVVSAGVEASLGSYSPSVIRLSGSDRYSTAAAISRHASSGGASKIYIDAIGRGANPARSGTPGGGSGGAVYNDGNTFTLTLLDTRVEHNHANEGGGAIFYVSNDRSGSLVIRDSGAVSNPSDGFETRRYPGLRAGERAPAGGELDHHGLAGRSELVL